MPLADAKLSGPRDAFKKGFQMIYFLRLLKRDDIMWNPATKKDGFSCDLFLMPFYVRAAQSSALDHFKSI